MKVNMSESEYIGKFKKLCEDCDRFTNSINVKKNNRAQTKLENMLSSVEADPDFIANVYKVLLHDTDCVVRHFAADHCLHEKLYVDEAMAVLEDLSENAELLMTRVSAGMLLFVIENPPEKFEQNLKENREAFYKEMIEEKERLAKEFLNNPKFNKQ